MQQQRLLLLFALGLLLFQACRPDSQRHLPDVSDIDVEVSLRRFDQDLFAIDTTRMVESLEQLEDQYPVFGQIFFERILGSKNPDVAPEGHETYVKGFITHPGVRHLYDTCQVLYHDMSDIKNEFTRAFKYYKYYFPERPTPDVTTFISEYTVAAFIYGDNSLAVGLDFFLGENYPYQQYNPDNTTFSGYMTRSFNRDHLVSKTIQPLVDETVGPPNGTRMLDFMINNGKKLYLLDLLLPTTPDSVKLEITPKQVQWLNDNELEMWAYFLDQKLLYNSTWQDIRKYLDYSPNSPGMPEEAPGRTANWMGWQIVKAYVKRHPEATLTQMLEMTDSQAFLDQSKYKPRK